MALKSTAVSIGIGVGCVSCVACSRWLYKSKPMLLPRRTQKDRPVADADLTADANKISADLLEPPLASQIVSDCQEGRRSVIETLDFFLERAKVCAQLTNCVVQESQDAVEQRARAIAAELDKLPVAEKLKRPLLGLPFSVKECYLFRGTDSTAGLKMNYGKPQVEDAALVAQLLELGAVPLCKTNVPQIMYSWECSNPLYGVTSHPLHRSFIPGGSSGGEAALLAAGGSVVGIGTDIGGSCRIPAHMSGCCGLKCTKGRMSTAGKSPPMLYGDGQQIIASCSGPMARTALDIAFLTRALCSERSIGYAQKNLDSAIVPVVWNEAAFQGQSGHSLKVGYYVDDGFLEASPACVRAVREAVAALERSGVVCVEFKPPNITDMFMTYVSLLATGAPHISAILMQPGESIADSLTKLLASATLPSWLRLSIAALMERTGAPLMARFLRAVGTKTGEEYYELVAALQQQKASFAKAFASDLDLLLAPVHVLPTHPHMTSKDIVPTCAYAAIYNAIDYPAGVVPVTTVKATDTWAGPLRDSVLDPKIRAIYARTLAAATPFPVGVQLVGRPFQEELVIRGMRLLEEALKSGRSRM